jgi:uncharacterized protein
MHQRIIKKEKDGYHVYSEDGKKHLGGPYKTEDEAKKRLEQIEYFKNKNAKASSSPTEKRDWSGGMNTELNYAGYQNAKRLINHGKINEGPFKLMAADRAKMLGPDGTDIAEHSKHHLGITRSYSYDQPESNKDHKYPIIKDGEVYTQALHGSRNEAHEAGHESVKGAASELLGDAKLYLDPSERSRSNAIAIPEKRVLHLESELRVKKKPDGTSVIVGKAAVFNKLSQILGPMKGLPRGFVEKLSVGAFEDCLARCDVRCLRNHDPDLLLGRSKSGTLRIWTDSDALHYEADPPEDEVGRSTVMRIERGDLDGSSFSFTVDDGDDDWDDSTDPPTRTINNIRDLFDVGPVTYPAYLDSTSSLRSMPTYDRLIESRALARREQDRKWQRLKILKLRMGHSIS